jgi:hypothetical protein
LGGVCGGAARSRATIGATIAGSGGLCQRLAGNIIGITNSGAFGLAVKEDEPLSNARRARWLREQCRALQRSGGPLSSSGTAQLDPMTRRLTFTSAEGEQAVWQVTVFDEPKVLRLSALDRWDFVPVE